MIAIPPLIYLSGFVIGLVMELAYPVPILPDWIARWAGVLIALISIPIVVSAVRAMHHAKTTINVRKPTTAIVSGGPFRWSRNPVYLSLTLFYLGIALLINSLWIAGWVVPILVVMRWGVIAREEQYLERKFGPEYLAYKAKTRRWF